VSNIYISAAAAAAVVVFFVCVYISPLLARWVPYQDDHRSHREKYYVCVCVSCFFLSRGGGDSLVAAEDQVLFYENIIQLLLGNREEEELAIVIKVRGGCDGCVVHYFY